MFRGREFFVKRDELIDPLLSGNKYRKLYSLMQMPAERYRRLTSYGGTQSNAMLSIAALCRQKGWQFHYTAKALPGRLKEHPTGNFKLAIELGMQLHEVSPERYHQAISDLQDSQEESELLVPQGGADPLAARGINILAEEITSWQRQMGMASLNVVTPSGTGTTAYYLACALPDLNILTTPVVGDSDYLHLQMRALGDIPDNLCIIESSKKQHFAKPYPELLSIWRELKAAGIAFDLIYGAKMWHTLMQHPALLEGPTLYIHSGGLIGNETMLNRYFHKGLI
ncbi:pyridoxal-phosphate dependent enzyme [Mariprofundus ferrinatatus]|nr:pyridoxal-phosphate dependent enzyme [Mariprofundus ferrinatatus]